MTMNQINTDTVLKKKKNLQKYFSSQIRLYNARNYGGEQILHIKLN